MPLKLTCAAEDDTTWVSGKTLSLTIIKYVVMCGPGNLKEFEILKEKLDGWFEVRSLSKI
jgi:hypothetical protein